MRQWLVCMGSVVFTVWASAVSAQMVETEVVLNEQELQADFPPMPFERKQSIPFSLSIVQRDYYNGGPGLQGGRDYLRQEQARLSRGGAWQPVTPVLLSGGADQDHDSFSEQTIFHLLYRFSFD